MNYQQGVYPESDVSGLYLPQEQNFALFQQREMTIYVVSVYFDNGKDTSYSDIVAFRNFADAERMLENEGSRSMEKSILREERRIQQSTQEKVIHGFKKGFPPTIVPATPYTGPSATEIVEQRKWRPLPGNINSFGDIVYQKVLENDGVYARVMVVTKVQLL